MQKNYANQATTKPKTGKPQFIRFLTLSKKFFMRNNQKKQFHIFSKTSLYDSERVFDHTGGQSYKKTKY
jgi:hypothetical protein